MQSPLQLAVDIEVLQVIARTRMDIRAIRAKYAAMKTGRIPLPQGNSIGEVMISHVADTAAAIVCPAHH